MTWPQIFFILMFTSRIMFSTYKWGNNSDEQKGFTDFAAEIIYIAILIFVLYKGNFWN